MKKIIPAIVFNFAALGFGIILALLVAEGAIRLWMPQALSSISITHDRELGPIPLPGASGQMRSKGIYEYTFRHNSKGWRGAKEFDFEKAGDYRFLFMGDSFTYGVGVHDDEVFSVKAEQALSTLSGKNVEIMNAGNPGKGTDYALKFYREVGWRYEADVVVLLFFPNDYTDNQIGNYYEWQKDGSLVEKNRDQLYARAKRSFSASPVFHWLITRSHLMHLCMSTASRRAAENEWRGVRATIQPLDQGAFYSGAINRQITSALLKALKNEIENDERDMFVFYIPSRKDLEILRSTGVVSTDEKVFLDLTKEHQIESASLSPFFIESGGPTEKFYHPEDHWNAEGHRLAADAIARILWNRMAPKA